jgi:hypothetical protein
MIFNRGSGRWVYIDKTGAVAVKPAPDITVGAGEFREGRARVQIGGGTNVLLRNGKIDYNFKAAETGDLCDGLVRVKKDKKWGFADKDGKPAFEAQFDDARDFSEGLAAVAVNQAPAGDPKRPPKPIYKWGCIDKTGKLVVEPKYDFVGPCSEGMMHIVVAGPSTGSGQAKHGYMDKTGRVAVEPRFDVGWEFSRGLARVKTDGKEGYIDKTGAFVWQPSK